MGKLFDSHQTLEKSEPRHVSIENEEKQSSQLPSRGYCRAALDFKATGVFSATSFLCFPRQNEHEASISTLSVAFLSGNAAKISWPASNEFAKSGRRRTTTTSHRFSESFVRLSSFSVFGCDQSASAGPLSGKATRLVRRRLFGPIFS